MAYYIFLKSLRSLEEFRKNPHVKIPPKSSSTNFPSLGKFKIQFLFEKIYFLRFQPTRLSRPAHSPGLGLPAGPTSPAQIASPRGLSAGQPAHAFSVFCRSRFPLQFAPSRAGRLPRISLTSGPRMSDSSPTSGRPSSPAPPPIPGHQAPLRSAPRVLSNLYHLAFISPPLIPLLNLSSSRPSSMSLRTLIPALTAPATSPRRSPDPYKRRATPPSFTAPLPALNLLSPSCSPSLTERRRHRALPRRRPSSSTPLEPG
jgi:hypothetical protein